jgi:hypothetical protein
MNINLIKEEDVSYRKRKVIKKDVQIENHIEHIEKPIGHIELVSEEECTSIKKRCAERKTLKELSREAESNDKELVHESKSNDKELVHEIVIEDINVNVHNINDDIGWALKPSTIFKPIVKRKTEKQVQVVRTKKEKSWITRRNSCKYYDIENNTCLIYKRDTCYNCKKKLMEKLSRNEKAWVDRYMKKHIGKEVVKS